MPYIYDPNLDKENQDQLGQVQISGSSPTSDSQGNASGSSQKQGLNTGSGYQNLDAYMNTNDSQKFGQEVVGKVQSDVDTAKQNQTDASNQFKSQVSDLNKTPTSKDINSAIANPSGANAQDFQKWENQSYSGPKSLAEAPDAWNQYWSGTNKADTSTQLLGSEPGRFALLDSYYGRPSYSFGEKSLDNLFLQHGGIGQQTKTLQGQAAQLKSQGQQQATALQGIASTKAGEVEASRNAARAAVGIDDKNQVIRGAGAGALGSLYDTVDAGVDPANQARAAAGAQFNKDLTSGSLTQGDWQALGLDPNQALYDINLNDPRYTHAGSTLDKNSLMTKEQQARIQALSQLAGVSDTYANSDLQDKGADFTFDKASLLNDIAGKQAQYNSDWKTFAAKNPLGLWANMGGSEDDAYTSKVQAFNDAHKVGRTAGNYANWGEAPPTSIITSMEGKTPGATPPAQIPSSTTLSPEVAKAPYVPGDSGTSTQVVSSLGKTSPNIDYALPSAINNSAGPVPGGTSVQAPQQTKMNQASYDAAWNLPAVQNPGEKPTSMAQLQAEVDRIAASQAQYGRTTPESWGGSNGDQARAYLAQINAWKAQHVVDKVLDAPAPTITQPIAGKGRGITSRLPNGTY